MDTGMIKSLVFHCDMQRLRSHLDAIVHVENFAVCGFSLHVLSVAVLQYVRFFGAECLPTVFLLWL